MAYSQDDLDAIRSTIAKGERTVQFADRSVTYRSMDELLAAEARILQAISSRGRAKQTVGIATKGLR